MGSDCMSRPRAATRATASESENTPAMWAATTSPIEWPPSRSGRMPQAVSSRNSATSKVNRAACVYIVWCSSSESASRITSRSGRPSCAPVSGSGCVAVCAAKCRSNSAHTSSKARANSGYESYSSRPMPARCEPCPENSTASRPGSAATTGAVRPCAIARTPSSSSSRVRPVTATRWAKAERVVASE